MRLNDKTKGKLSRMLEKARPMMEARKKVRMQQKRGKYVSRNEKYCFVRLNMVLHDTYPEMEVTENDVDILPGWEIDIVVRGPQEWIMAIEWDGAYHRKPIYGEAKLRMRKGQDEYKNKALHSKKCVLVRVKDDGSYNPKFVDGKVEKIMEIIDDLVMADVKAYGKIEI